LNVPVRVAVKLASVETRYPLNLAGEHCVMPTSPLRGLRLLLAEDAKDNQILLERILRKRGATVTFADDGEDAVRKALTQNFDLVLMDIQMPKLDGYEATRRLRSLGYPMPIVALTAHAMREEREKCLELGCNEHLPKPIDGETLVQTIVRLTASRFNETALTH
jgi:CheY-like chemotaxis protein